MTIDAYAFSEDPRYEHEKIAESIPATGFSILQHTITKVLSQHNIEGNSEMWEPIDIDAISDLIKELKEILYGPPYDWGLGHDADENTSAARELIHFFRNCLFWAKRRHSNVCIQFG